MSLRLFPDRRDVPLKLGTTLKMNLTKRRGSSKIKSNSILPVAK